MNHCDVLVIGGGIVGLSTAHRLTQRYPRLHVVLVEKEAEVAVHQTGRNSGVLHSGIYYKPGSLKARNCRAGKLAMQEFCEAEGVPYEICGKVIVAVDDAELPVLQRIYERGLANGVACELIERERLVELEPHAAGVRAIHVPEAGIVDYRAVCRRLSEIIEQRGSQLAFSTRVTGMTPDAQQIVVHTTSGDYSAAHVVNCAGLYCDRVMRLSGERPEAKIVPFRGEYYQLKPGVRHLCRNLIYPTPDPNFPFLGVHFTRMIDGAVECGPNAVLAFAREGYTKLDINLFDLAESLTYPGFLKMALKHWRMGAGEMWRSLSRRAFVRALRRLLPEITVDDLETAPAGVRAQAVDRAGNMVDDFVIQTRGRVIHIGNAPSPAATAALNIGQLIVDRLAEELT
jgi:L-2-hydroxyglutarate oxidase